MSHTVFTDINFFSNRHRENKATPLLQHLLENPEKFAIIPLKHLFTFNMFHSKAMF